MRLRFAAVVLVSMFCGCRCGEERLRTVEEPPPPVCTPSSEVCNAVDDDCDGEVDEELGVLSCGAGACAVQMPACVGGALQTCTPGSPSLEQCNGIDDDCDGAIDDDLIPLSCGTGACQQVVSSCESGVPASCGAPSGSAETCDGLDNDCDGTVDEGLLTNISKDLRVTNDKGSSDYVYAGWNGSQFGLAWQDRRDGSAQNGEIYFVPLSAAGERLSTQDIRITQSSSFTAHPALAWSGEAYGLVYTEGTNTAAEIYFQKLDGHGNLLGSRQRVSQASGSSNWPDIVWNGSAFGIAWTDDRDGEDDIYFRLVDADGVPLGPEQRITVDPGRQQSAILKWSGSEFGLAWTDFRHGKREVYFRRLTADGETLGSEVRVTDDVHDSAWPDLASNGTGWAVVWQDDRAGDYEVFFRRLDEKGSALGPEVRITDAAGFSGYPSVDWNGYQYGLSWHDGRAGASTVYFTAVNAAGEKTAGDLKVSSGSGQSMFTTALWNGKTYAFSWRDDRDGNTELYFAVVGCP